MPRAIVRPPESKHNACGHIKFDVRDLVGTCDKLEAYGVTILRVSGPIRDQVLRTDRYDEHKTSPPAPIYRRAYYAFNLLLRNRIFRPS